MKQLFHRAMQRLLSSEKGAVTVDWVVLTAAIVGLLFIIVQVLNESLIQQTTEDGIALTLEGASDAAAAAIGD
ncbi:MAG: hypothetical protein RIR62_2635 [Pseudomonadota bacterium]|jgi:hypothetical protein